MPWPAIVGANALSHHQFGDVVAHLEPNRKVRIHRPVAIELRPRRLDVRYKSVVSLGYPYAARAGTPNVDWRAEMRGKGLPVDDPVPV